MVFRSWILPYFIVWKLKCITNTNTLRVESTFSSVKSDFSEQLILDDLFLKYQHIIFLIDFTFLLYWWELLMLFLTFVTYRSSYNNDDKLKNLFLGKVAMKIIARTLTLVFARIIIRLWGKIMTPKLLLVMALPSYLRLIDTVILIFFTTLFRIDLHLNDSS